jgi:hypothetical protein
MVVTLQDYQVECAIVNVMVAEIKFVLTILLLPLHDSPVARMDWMLPSVRFVH